MEYPELLKSIKKNVPLVMKCKGTEQNFDYHNGRVEIGGGTITTLTASYCKHPDSSDNSNLVLEIVFDE